MELHEFLKRQIKLQLELVWEIYLNIVQKTCMNFYY